ncbi:hypothetical protein D3C71_2078140 [compost metagenome]
MHGGIAYVNAVQREQWHGRRKRAHCTPEGLNEHLFQACFALQHFMCAVAPVVKVAS